MQVELVSAERRLWSGEAEMVVARTTEGEIGVLPGHSPLLGELTAGPVRILGAAGGDVVAAIHGGFLSVTGDGVSILADVAELSSDIDVARAQASLERTQSAPEDDAEARAAAARARARVRAAELASAR